MLKILQAVTEELRNITVFKEKYFCSHKES